MKSIARIFLITLTLEVLALLTGCASTTLYNKDGQRIAAFQGDMTGAEYSMAADGSVRWKAATVDHSTPTKAQGEASTSKIQAAGIAVAASGLTSIIK